MRRMRSEQERQASQLEVLQHRVVLTEDAAQQARRAVEHSGHLATVRLGSRSPRGGAHPRRQHLGAPRACRGRRARERVQPPRAARLPQRPHAPSPASPSWCVRAIASRWPRCRRSAPPRRRRRPPAAAPGPAHTAAHDARPGGAVRPRRPPSGGRRARSIRRRHAPTTTALAMARARRCDEAVERFAGFLVRWPAHPHADNAMYWRAECLLPGGDALPRGMRRAGGARRGGFPVGNKVPDALFTLRSALRARGRRAAPPSARRATLTIIPTPRPRGGSGTRGRRR
jgi:TolA-binding protein